ncbi:hypothetical protein ACFW0F_06820 [Brucella anthropi]|uniref:hypothetical protein n=1 Tax=Brucella anthropi TaxID=529 RepID=UPI00366CC0B5
MPAWIIVLQGLLTPIIALIAVGVAFMQWRTAHHKVVMELFERRLAVYRELVSTAKNIINEGNLVVPNICRDLVAIRSEARFLFGADVESAINHLIDKAKRVGELRGGYWRDLSHLPQFAPRAKELEGLIEELVTAADTLSDVCAPYMRMSQRLSWPRRTFSEWFQDANAKRLSYSDKN